MLVLNIFFDKLDACFKYLKTLKSLLLQLVSRMILAEVEPNKLMLDKLTTLIK